MDLSPAFWEVVFFKQLMSSLGIYCKVAGFEICALCSVPVNLS